MCNSRRQNILCTFCSNLLSKLKTETAISQPKLCLVTKPLFTYQVVLAYKGKSVPLQPWSGPEGSRKLRFPDFATTAQDGGKVVSLMHRPPLPPGNAPGTHFC